MQGGRDQHEEVLVGWVVSLNARNDLPRFTLLQPKRRRGEPRQIVLE